MAAAVGFLSANSGWLSAAASIGSGLMSMMEGSRQSESIRQQGEMQAQQFRFQAQQQALQGEMALIQGQEKSINYRREQVNAQRQANSILERQQRANSAAVARSYAMGVQAFEGSPLDLQKFNDRVAGDENEIARANAEAYGTSAKGALRWGDLQKGEFDAAANISLWQANDAIQSASRMASQAQTRGLMSGLLSIGSGVMGFAKLGGPPAGAGAGSAGVIGTTALPRTDFTLRQTVFNPAPSYPYFR